MACDTGCSPPLEKEVNSFSKIFDPPLLDVAARRIMQPTPFNMKPSILPSRNPAIENKIQQLPGVAAEELEARNRLLQIQSRTISLPARGSRLRNAVDPSAKSSNDHDDGDEESPIDELRRQRGIIVGISKHPSLVPSRTSRLKATLCNDNADPRLELKGERKQSTDPKRFVEADRTPDERVGSSLPVTAFCRHESKVPPNTADERSTGDHVQERTGSSLPVKTFVRHESKVLPNVSTEEQDCTGATLPVKAFGRHESKVPPNTGPKETRLDSVASHSGASLPVKAFARHTSKAPSSFVATSGEPKRMDRQSIVPPSTKSKAENDEKCGLPLRHTPRELSKAPGNALPGADPTKGPTNKPPRNTFGGIARALRKKQSPSSDSMDVPVRRMLSLSANKMLSFRRKPTSFMASS